MITALRKFLCDLPYHSFAVGAGSLLLGVAALIALYQTRDVLEKVLEIKTAVQELKDGNKIIQTAVQELKDRNKTIQTAVDNIESERKYFTAHRYKKDLKKEKMSDLKALLPDEKSNLKPGDIYLPSQALPKLKEKLASQSPQSDVYAENFLRENLQIWSSDKIKN